MERLVECCNGRRFVHKRLGPATWELIDPQDPRMPSILLPTRLQNTPLVAMKEEATSTTLSQQVRDIETES